MYRQGPRDIPVYQRIPSSIGAHEDSIICIYMGALLLVHTEVLSNTYTQEHLTCVYMNHLLHVCTGSPSHTYNFKDSVMHRSRDYI